MDKENAGHRRQPEEEGISAAFLHEQLTQFVQQAQREFARGNYVYLEGLEQKVELLCKATLLLPPEEGKIFSSNLQSLMEDIEALEKAMKTEYKETQQQIEGLSLQRKAHVAYSVSELEGKPKPEE